MLKFKYIFFVCIFLLLNNDTQADSFQVPLVPKPKSVIKMNGQFAIKPQQTEIQWSVPDTSRLTVAMRQLTDALGIDAVYSSESKFKIWLGLPEVDSAFDQFCKKKKVELDDNIGEQGYVLLIDKRNIIVLANRKAGLFYGVQTLRQLMRGMATDDGLPCLKIVDWPDLKYRGVQDDISRGPVPTMDFMKTQIRRYASMKLNLVSFYIEHVVKTMSHPDFAPAGGAISIEEWRDLTEYAADYFMETTGNFQSLAHFEKIMAYPQYRHLGETDRMIAPVLDESFRFLEDIYDEMMPAFSAPFFNVNCDETWDLGRGVSKTLVDSIGVARVYANHLNRLEHVVSRHGKRMMFWGDIVLQHPEIFDMIPKDVIIGAWDYSGYDSFDSFLRPYREAGFDFFFSPGVLNSNRMMPDYQMTFTNIRNFVRDGYNYGALGMLNTVWDDGGKAIFSQDWYGVAYSADHGWHVNDDPVERFDQRFNRAVYGDQTASVAAALQKMTELTALAPTQEMNEAVFWKKLVPKRQEEIRFNLSEWDAVKEITQQAEELFDSARPQIYADDLVSIRFTNHQYRFLADSRSALFRAAEYYRNACIMQTTDRHKARQMLTKALRNIGNVRLDLLALRNDYRTVWLMENRSYWLDHILDLYDAKISNLTHAEQLLMQAIADFDQGHYLPSPNKIRLDIEQTSGQYFQYWLLCGPFPNVSWQGRKVDYLKSMGGETEATPRPGSEFINEQGEKYRWIKYASPRNSEINLADVYDKNTEAIAYAYCRIESQDSRTIRATLGSNDGIEVICNGERIYTKHIKRALIVDEDEIALPLNKGRNHLLLKIDQNKGGWGFSFRLPDVTVRNHKYKYRIVN